MKGFILFCKLFFGSNRNFADSIPVMQLVH